MHKWACVCALLGAHACVWCVSAHTCGHTCVCTAVCVYCCVCVQISLLEHSKQRQTLLFDQLDTKCAGLKAQIDAYRMNAVSQHDLFETVCVYVFVCVYAYTVEYVSMCVCSLTVEYVSIHTYMCVCVVYLCVCVRSLDNICVWVCANLCVCAT